MNTVRAAQVTKSGNPLCDIPKAGNPLSAKADAELTQSHVELTLRAMPPATEATVSGTRFLAQEVAA
jgi:hypothetical protein